MWQVVRSRREAVRRRELYPSHTGSPAVYHDSSPFSFALKVLRVQVSFQGFEGTDAV